MSIPNGLRWLLARLVRDDTVRTRLQCAGQGACGSSAG
jgi:hypothetical protein